MAELITKQLQALQFNSEVATAADVSSFVNASTTELSTSLIARIQALEGFSTFIGVKDALPESAENGQIVIVGEKEYIWGPKADGVAGWTELGDTTAEAAAIDELSSAVADLAATKADVSSVNASVEALTKAIDDVEASLSGYDTVGSAAAALTSAKTYTDEQIVALSNDVHYRIAEEYRAAATYTDSQVSALSVDVYGSLQSVDTEIEAISGTLSTFGDIVTHNASEFDLSGSAAAALTSAKAYTDTEVKKVSDIVTEISSDMSYLATKEELNTLAQAKADIEAVEYLKNSKADKETVEGISNTLATFGDIVTHNVSEFDLSGSADAALTSAKAYTDEQIAAVEGEISSLTDVVETKADQTAVDAAISAINENISTLSAKAEEDPVFTAWKDSESITLGSGSFASEDYAQKSITIGYNSTSSGERNITVGPEAYGCGGNDTITIGTSATASGDRSIVIGLDAGVEPVDPPVAPDSIAIGSNARVWSEGSIAIGTSTAAYAQNSVQLGSGENSVENSFQFRSTQIVDGDGFITTANLAGIDALKTTVSAIEEVTAEDNVQVLREAVNTLVAAIKTFVGA
jgi:hypothetical protein